VLADNKGLYLWRKALGTGLRKHIGGFNEAGRSPPGSSVREVHHRLFSTVVGTCRCRIILAGTYTTVGLGERN
jgi:hypothetical protein